MDGYNDLARMFGQLKNPSNKQINFVYDHAAIQRQNNEAYGNLANMFSQLQLPSAQSINAQPPSLDAMVNESLAQDAVMGQIQTEQQFQNNPEAMINTEILNSKQDVITMQALADPNLQIPQLPKEQPAIIPPPNIKEVKKGSIFQELIADTKIQFASMLKTRKIEDFPQASQDFIRAVLSYDETKDIKLTPEMDPRNVTKINGIIANIKNSAFNIKQEIGYQNLSNLVNGIQQIKKETQDTGNQKLMGQALLEKFGQNAIAGAQLSQKLGMKGIIGVQNKEQFWLYAWNVLLYRPFAATIGRLYNSLYVACPIVPIIAEIIIVLVYMIWKFAKFVLWTLIYLIVPLLLIELISCWTQNYDGWFFSIIHAIATVPRALINWLYNTVVGIRYYRKKWQESYFGYGSPHIWWQFFASFIQGWRDVEGTRAVNTHIKVIGIVDPIKAMFASNNKISHLKKGAHRVEAGWVRVKDASGSISEEYRTNVWVDSDNIAINSSGKELGRGYNWTYQYQLGQHQFFYDSPARDIIAYLLWCKILNKESAIKDAVKNFYYPKYPKLDDNLKPLIKKDDQVIKKNGGSQDLLFYDVATDRQKAFDSWKHVLVSPVFHVDYTEEIWFLVMKAVDTIYDRYGWQNSKQYGGVPKTFILFQMSLVGDGWQENIDSIRSDEIWSEGSIHKSDRDGVGSRYWREMINPKKMWDGNWFNIFGSDVFNDSSESLIYELWAAPQNKQTIKKIKLSTFVRYDDYIPFSTKQTSPFPPQDFNLSDNHIKALKYLEASDLPLE